MRHRINKRRRLVALFSERLGTWSVFKVNKSGLLARAAEQVVVEQDFGKASPTRVASLQAAEDLVRDKGYEEVMRALQDTPDWEKVATARRGFL